MEEKHLYDLPKDMLVKIIMTIQDCKNLNNDDLIRNIKANILEGEKRKLERIKEFLLKEDSEKGLNLKDLISDIDYIKIRQEENNLSNRMVIMFADKTNIRIVSLDRMMLVVVFNENNKPEYTISVNNLSPNIPNGVKEKYKNYTAIIQTLILTHFHKIINYLGYPFVEIDSF